MTAGQRNCYSAISDLLPSYGLDALLSALLAAEREREEMAVGPVHDLEPIRHRLCEAISRVEVAV